jgi:DNA primase
MIPIVDVVRALGRTVREDGPGKGWTACPATNHRDDTENPKCGLNNELGAFHCFKCDARGDEIGFVKHIRECDAGEAFAWIRETFHLEHRNLASHSPMNPLEQLASLRNWRVEALHTLGTVAYEREVRFPMRDAKGKITGWRRRRGDNSKFRTKEGETKAIAVPGSHNGLFYPTPLPSGTVLVVEGEADTVAALSAGWLAVVGTPGCSPGKKCVGYLQRLLAGRDVVLAPDPDEPGRAWLKLIGEALLNARCSVRYIPALPGCDLDKRLAFHE